MSYLYAVRMIIPDYPIKPIKVGYSTDPHKRRESYTAGPFPVEWMGVWEGTRDDERDFHRRYKDHRMNGEWFLPDQELVDEVEGRIIFHDMLDSVLHPEEEVVWV